ncbi:hypothetical protein G7054_g6616 [Neopestalotiopsis clavispora]|nr:hypothetical protein G7054_g6616 [Neopestalotiopsis clavispora]
MASIQGLCVNIADPIWLRDESTMGYQPASGPLVPGQSPVGNPKIDTLEYESSMHIQEFYVKDCVAEPSIFYPLINDDLQFV